MCNQNKKLVYLRILFFHENTGFLKDRSQFGLITFKVFTSYMLLVAFMLNSGTFRTNHLGMDGYWNQSLWYYSMMPEDSQPGLLYYYKFFTVREWCEARITHSHLPVKIPSVGMGVYKCVWCCWGLNLGPCEC